MKPQGLPLFTQQQEIVDFYSSATIVQQCTRDCKTAKDCNLSCKKWEMKSIILIFLMLLSTFAYSQTKTIQTPDGNYQTVKVVFNNEAEVVQHFNLVPTVATYTDVKGNKYLVYTLHNEVYYIKSTKNGYKKFKITIK